MAKESVDAVRSAGTTAGRINSCVATYKVPGKNRASDRLEEDAQAMEERLIQLRLKMLEDKQKLEKDLPAKFGGSRWRSAQETIGSVSRYAKDVEDRMLKSNAKGSSKKKVSEPEEAKPKKKKKKKTDGNSSNTVLVPCVATVKKWTTQHVLQWLTSLALDELHSAFEFHQVTGAVLLQMEPDDFTKIGVDRLSTRNLLWKELERIKDAARMAIHRGSLEASEIIDPKIKDVAPVPEVASPTKGVPAGVHWSHVKPLRDATDTSRPQEMPVNLADGEFDEDASHASFMKALLDWRAGDDGDITAAAQDDTMWFNPLATSNNDDPPSSERGGALLDGEYDEAKEQEAFRRAVLAWRLAGTSGGETNSRPSTAEIERIEQGCATAQRKSCWHCYRVVRADSLVRDEGTMRDFCGKACQASFNHEHARLYTKKQAVTEE